jgi:hypothetical protein
MRIGVLMYSSQTSSLSGGWRSMEVNATTLHFKIEKKTSNNSTEGWLAPGPVSMVVENTNNLKYR